MLTAFSMGSKHFLLPHSQYLKAASTECLALKPLVRGHLGDSAPFPEAAGKPSPALNQPRITETASHGKADF